MRKRYILWLYSEGVAVASYRFSNGDEAQRAGERWVGYGNYDRSYSIEV